jgi:hypothetical protein
VMFPKPTKPSMTWDAIDEGYQPILSNESHL